MAIRERAIPISRYVDPTLPSGGLTTSIVAITTDVVRDGKPVVGYGFSSIGRYAQSGLIRERFAPRLLDAEPTLDPFQAWDAMMKGEKPGGHGERCVAVGTLDMALWDAAAKIAGVPLHRHLRDRVPQTGRVTGTIAIYAGGGYVYPHDDIARLREEVLALLDAGYTRIKIKIGALPIKRDLQRIEAVLELLPSGDRLAVDAMNAYSAEQARTVAAALEPYGLWWFEDICDPLDLETHARVAERYSGALAAGEALFSRAEAVLLQRYGGLRPRREILLFDPVHCYGLVGYLQIIDAFDNGGWPRSAFWPHGGHLIGQHVVAAFGLGGAEVNPRSFAPFGGVADDAVIRDGRVAVLDAPGIGFERKADLFRLFRELELSDPLTRAPSL